MSLVETSPLHRVLWGVIIVYDVFCSNFRQYLRHHSSDLCNNEGLLEILNPFYGLSDYETYENWKLRSDMRYYETSNLIYALSNSTDNPSFGELFEELCENGYDAYASEEFKLGVVNDQLKLIHYLLDPSVSLSAGSI